MLPSLCLSIFFYFEPSQEKSCLSYMRTTKAQFSLRIRAVITSLSIILTEICIFSKIFKRMQVYKKTKKNLHIFSLRFTFSLMLIHT